MRRWHTFKTANRLQGANRSLQVLLLLLLAGCLNYLAMRHYQRSDLSQRQPHTLSPESRAYLAELEQPVDFIVTLPEHAPREEDRVLFRYVASLLREYAHHSRRGGEPQVRVEYVDIYKDLARAELMAREFGLREPGSVVVRGPSRFRVVDGSALIRFEDGQPVLFQGEAQLTSALLEVSNDAPHRIYWLTGHGEMTVEDTDPGRGLSQAGGELRSRNMQSLPMDLTRMTEVPADAALVIVADPQGPVLPAVAQKLRQYLIERAGRMLIWVGPGVATGLDSLFADWGLRVDDMVVLEQGGDYLEGSGSLLIRQFAPHPVTDPLIRSQTFVVSGLNRPVRASPAVGVEERLQVTPLLGSSRQSWAESAYGSHGPPTYDPQHDLPGPVSIAAIAERRTPSQLGIDLPGGRVVVFGARDLFVNRRFATPGNTALFINTVNWLLDNERLLAIPPRPAASYQILIGRQQFRTISLLFLIVPGVAGMVGVGILWLRKL
jgi:ABC-type uncharacterized transport system involved in gliding motility auxiliary subunit